MTILFFMAPVIAEETIPWEKEFEIAAKTAKEQDKPILLFFKPPAFLDNKTTKELETGALSDQKVVTLVKDKIIATVVALNTPQDAVQKFNKYNISADSVPQLSFLISSGQEVRELRHSGKNIAADELIKKLNELININTKIIWESNLEDAMKHAKEQVKPVVVITTKKDDKESATFLTDLDTYRHQIYPLKNDFIWYKQENSKLTIEFTNPYTGTKKGAKPANKMDQFKADLQFYFNSFKKDHLSSKFVCTKCNKTKDKEGKCCNQKLIKIRAFICEKCGNASAKEKECCKEKMKPKIEN
ncbi:MAG: hypothetical protein HY606_08210 [Planctomycetes bacterium]|nr:hypothetical protein [Planctomycetota bacterium]